MTYIKSLIALTTLALLTACGGGVAVTNNIGQVNINNGNPCATEPFGKDCGAGYNAARIKKIEECLIDNTAETPTCDLAIMAHPCIDDPFTESCTTNPEFADYIDDARRLRTAYCEANPDKTAFCAEYVKICKDNTDVFNLLCTNDERARETACQTHGTDETRGHSTCATTLIPLCVIADPFAHAGCDDVAGIDAEIRTPYCQTLANVWNPKCTDGTHGTVDATRMMACQLFGTNTDRGGDDSCATSLATACGIANPFAHAGCDDVTDIDSKVRTMYCQTPANAWNPKCMNDTHGTVDATRVTACQMFGTDTDTGGHDSCADSLASVCDDIADPFIYPGCDNVAGIDAGVRVMYCTMQANAFKTGCKTDGTHDELAENGTSVNDARLLACLFSPIDVPADLSCETDTLVEQGCATDPFNATNTGCRNLIKFPMIADKYCGLNPSVSDCEVKTSSWVEGFGENTPPTTPASTNPPRHGFLQGGTATVGFGSLRNSDNTTPDVHRLNLQDATYGNVPLGGDVGDGIAYFRASINNKNGGYAGIFSGTNLGAPLSADFEESEPIVKWYGKFGVVGLALITNQDFILNVNFQTRKIDAFVKFGSTTHYKLDGDFNDRGVIVNGTVSYGNFTNNNPESLIPDGNNKLGILTGLIGQEGAVGVFHADDNAAGTTTYVGGFVAAPPEPCVATDTCPANTAAWLRSFPADVVLTATPATTNPPLHGFLRGGVATVDFGTLRAASNTDPTVRPLNLQDATYNNVPLGGDEEDGMAFFETYNGTESGGYAGIFSGTDLGAPLPVYVAGTEPIVVWYGKFELQGSAKVENRDFTLNVNFKTRKIDAFVQFGGPNHYKLGGDFNDKGVIVNGTIIYGAFTNRNPDMRFELTKAGILTGLIGSEGAVGIFHADDDADGPDSYVGGFVAAPYILPADDFPNKITFSDWERGFVSPLAPSPNIGFRSRRNQFLRGTETDLPTTGTRFSGQDNAPAIVVTITLADNDFGGEEADGFSYFRGYIPAASRSYYYAGILSDTDLGAPLTQQPTSTLWRGHIRSTGWARLNNSFTLTVNFGVGSQVGGGTLSAFVPFGGSDTTLFYKIDAEFNADGLIITGDAENPNILYDDFTGANPDMPKGFEDSHTGILSGIIGEQGVVAAFISNPHATNNALAFSGGFVAEPVAPADDFPDKVTFNDWLRLSEDTPSAVPTIGTPANEFLRGTKIDLRTKGTQISSSDTAAPTITTVTLADKGLGGEEADGFASFNGYIPSADRRYYYAGVLSGTDLGAPLTGKPTSIVWRGHIVVTGLADLNKSFNLTINLGAGSQVGGGTLSAFVPFGSSATTLYYKIDAEFDAGGLIITGDATNPNIVYDEFTGSDPDRPEGSENSHTGILSGIIGEQGVVAAFISNPGTNDSYIFSGGFVAAPPIANQATWVASFNGGVPARLTRTTTAADRQRQFLAAGETALIDINDTIGVPVYFGLTFKSAMYNGEVLSGDNDIKDGFAGLVDSVSGSNKVYYAGILSGTDLGAPLTETFGSITWNGQIETVLAGLADIKKDFSLKITLGEGKGVAGALGSIAGAVLSDGTNHYQLTGTYDANGVIDGEVIYGAFTGSIAEDNLETTATANGILTGLIGEHGAVGVFLAGGGTKENIPDRATPTGGYAGGFVVSGPQPPRQPVVQPDDTDTDNVAFNDWLRGFGGFPPLTKLTVPPRDRKREFLAGGTAGLATTGAMNVDDTRNISANLASLGRGGDAADGYNYFFDTVATNTYIPYAGLLADTDLGARLTETEGTAVWNGKLRATLNGTVHTNTDLALTITYGGTGDVAGSIAGEVQGNGNTLYQLRGDYDDSGVIDGTVYYGRVNSVDLPNLVRTNSNEDPNGFLTGLIGAQGAVGVFISGTGTKGAIDSPTGNYYAGGFVVAPE